MMQNQAMFRTLLLTATLVVLAAALPATEARAQAKPPAESKAPEYKPPQRGAPSRRVGGSSRGSGGPLPRVMLLAPDHVGFTVSETPSLYWYLSKPTTVRVEVTLIDDKGELPLVEYAVTNADGPAVHRIDLAARGVKLRPDVEYQWSVSIVPDPKERSNDVMAGGVLKRVSVPATVGARSGAAKEELARLYAGEGIWYDAIALYSELIAERPADQALRAARAALLEQVGLKEVAEFDARGGR
jgi:Domain of Unknown Function (DUF928)